jgi:hypothetical protein
MKKTARKMTLNRETLRHLNAENLRGAAGGSYPDPYTQHQDTCLRTLCTSDPIEQNSKTNCA